MIDFVKIEQTCEACPSQWDAWDAEGNYYYIRYRWGHLTVDVAASEQAWNNSEETCIVAESIGGGFDGYMSTDEMLGHVREAVKQYYEEP